MFSVYKTGKFATAPVVMLNVGFSTNRKYEETLLQKRAKIKYVSTILSAKQVNPTASKIWLLGE